MTAKTDIKFYVYTNNGAPQLENRFGCMLDVLDACLVNGFGTQNVASTSINDKEITLKFNQAHNFLQYQVIKVMGADQTQLNSEHRILNVTDNTVMFKIDSVLTNITGTLICSLPPLGFEKPFSSKNDNGGGKGAYRSTNTLLASRPFLRVVDELGPVYGANYAKYAKVGIVEDMSDIDTLLGTQAPYDASSPNKNWVGSGSSTSAYNGWAKWYYATSNDITTPLAENATATNGIRPWVLIGTGDYFYILPSTISSSLNAMPYGFGAFSSTLEIDSANNFLSATNAYKNISSSAYLGATTPISCYATSATMLIQRKYDQTANYATAFNQSLAIGSSASSSGAQNAISSSGNIIFSPVSILETTSNTATSIQTIRGQLPGIYWLFQTTPYTDLFKFEKSQQCFIAKTVIAGTTTKGQIVIKIGDLDE